MKSNGVTFHAVPSLPAFFAALGVLAGCQMLDQWAPKMADPPHFGVPGGTYSADQSVSITCATTGAKIHYTTDGTMPTSSAPVYEVPVSIAGDGTSIVLKARAMVAGQYESDPVSATYIIRYPAAGTPQFGVPSGRYSVDQAVSITCPTEDATIHYTTDGSIPTTGSPVYDTPVPIAGHGTSVEIRAIAVRTGMAVSATASAAYAISSLFVAGACWDASGSYSAVYWKNGVLVDLPGDLAAAFGIDVSDGVAYLCGMSFYKPCFWRDGVRTFLAIDALSQGGVAYSIGVSGNDVYVAGCTVGSTSLYMPVLWKNGVRSDLPVMDSTRGGMATGISMYGGVPCVSGMTFDSNGVLFPCYWMNSSRTELSVVESTRGGYAFSIAVSGNDVYVSGFVKDSSGVGSPCYWTNGTRTDLSGGTATSGPFLCGIAVAEGSVYVAGATNDTTPAACYWRNGGKTVLPSAAGGHAYGVAVSGSSLFFCGGTGTIGGMGVPCSWENGVRTDLPLPSTADYCGIATSILFD